MSKDIKPLSIKETALKEEMKSRCLNKGLYIDKNAEEKFKMLCHLEDFEITYWDLKERINKAIEYIKHSNWLRQDQIYDSSCDMQGWEVKELLEILKGGD